MNWKFGVTLGVLLAAAMLAYGAGDQTTTVRFFIPGDLSFTISYPATTVFILFSATGPTCEVNASNQTDTMPIMNFTNTGNTAEYYNMKLDATVTGATMKCGPLYSSWQSVCDCQAGTSTTSGTAAICCNITTTNVRINATGTTVGLNQTAWCWAQFVSASAGTTDRTLTVNASSS